jgi:predicted tellurium resistance membrane protein TerC
LEKTHGFSASGLIKPCHPDVYKSLSALLAIVIIDLVLAGDNAIVIALAARNLPQDLRKKAIIWGTFGAVAVRTAMTLVVVWLLKIPGLLLAGLDRLQIARRQRQ